MEEDGRREADIEMEFDERGWLWIGVRDAVPMYGMPLTEWQELFRSLDLELKEMRQ